MAEEETRPPPSLLELYEQRFGEHLPPIRREDVKGFLKPPADLADQQPAARHYPQGSRDHGVPGGAFLRQGGRPDPRRRHPQACWATSPRSRRATSIARAQLEKTILTPDVRAEEDRTRQRMFVLQYVQPGLAGLMDGSVSTLAPLFAAAFATHRTGRPFSSASPPRSAPASAWDSPKRCPTTAR